MLKISPDGEADFEPCLDCGNRTKSVWGYVENETGAFAVYYARWTPGHPDRGAQLLISMRGWGEGADPTQKRSVGLDSRMGQDRPAFMVVDAASLPWGSEPTLGKMLTREEAFATGATTEAFEVADHLVFEDPRLKSFYLSGA